MTRLFLDLEIVAPVLTLMCMLCNKEISSFKLHNKVQIQLVIAKWLCEKNICILHLRCSAQIKNFYFV